MWLSISTALPERSGARRPPWEGITRKGSRSERRRRSRGRPPSQELDIQALALFAAVQETGVFDVEAAEVIRVDWPQDRSRPQLENISGFKPRILKTLNQP